MKMPQGYKNILLVFFFVGVYTALQSFWVGLAILLTVALVYLGLWYIWERK